MRRHWLGVLVGLCMSGLAAPTWAMPMTATQTGEVTQIRNGEFALDWAVGTPATLFAEWDTDDFIDLAEMGFSPGLFFLVTLADNPDASLTITVGSSTWVETDDIDVPSFPFLLFDSDGDLLGAQFRGANSDGHFFSTSVLFFLLQDQPPGRFFAGSIVPTDLDPSQIGARGDFEVPEFDGVFPTRPVTEPGAIALLGLGLLGIGLTRRRAN